MIDHLDHLVLTTRERERCIDFYTRVLGMRLETFGAGRVAFKYGGQKINLHEYGKEFLPKAAQPTPGSLDLCFIASIPLDDWAGSTVRIRIGATDAGLASSVDAAVDDVRVTRSCARSGPAEPRALLSLRSHDDTARPNRGTAKEGGPAQAGAAPDDRARNTEGTGAEHRSRETQEAPPGNRRRALPAG